MNLVEIIYCQYKVLFLTAWTNNPNNNDLKELEGARLRHSSNIEGRHFFDNNNRNLESNLKPMGNPNPGRSLGAAAFQHSSNDPTIRLNLFEGSEVSCIFGKNGRAIFAQFLLPFRNLWYPSRPLQEFAAAATVAY
jgi:hypothetical protein